MNRLTVIGFGLIGGSFALAHKRRRPTHVTAIDFTNVLSHPRAIEATDERIDARDVDRVAAALAASSLVLLATPVRVICEALPRVLETARLVTDAGSTKREVQRAARACPRGARFVPAHPMAGLPDGGIEHARADLFEKRPWFVCPEGADDDAVKAVELWVEDAGARAVRLTAGEHDAAVARTSHLPRLVASAVLGVVDAARASPAAGPALERLARTVGGPESIWRDIFASNADEIASAILELTAALVPVAEELTAGGTTERAEALLRTARRVRAELNQTAAAAESPPACGHQAGGSD
jgi:prephenate dehydrogenase